MFQPKIKIKAVAKFSACQLATIVSLLVKIGEIYLNGLSKDAFTLHEVTVQAHDLFYMFAICTRFHSIRYVYDSVDFSRILMNRLLAFMLNTSFYFKYCI